jgi:hypothetical protein
VSGGGGIQNKETLTSGAGIPYNHPKDTFLAANLLYLLEPFTPPLTGSKRGRSAMRTCIRIGIATAFLVTALCLGAGRVGAVAEGPSPVMPGEKALVMDGHVFHDVGQLWLHATNWGLVGSQPTRLTTYAQAPSAQWPGGSGPNYLYSAGLWVGAVKLGERLVSTGQFTAEFRPTVAPDDTIYQMARGDVGGSRYPFEHPDDDGDGLENEDPKNGQDDDLDGLVDEDFAAISNQHFRCVYADTAAIIQQSYPDHTPLDIEVVQESFQWSIPSADDFVGLDFTVRNVGGTDLQNAYIGFFADFDIPAETAGADDDLAGSWQGSVPVAGGDFVPVQLSYMFDGDSVSPLPGYMGICLCGHTVDASGQAAPSEVGVRSIQIFRGTASFSQGGDPTNDSERYQSLAAGDIDPNVPMSAADDYRVLISCGPFPELAPGAAVTFQVAMVAGAGLDDLLQNAAEAVRTYQGARFNRDGDPSTGPGGKEFVVNWLRPEEIPVAVATGRLQARAEQEAVVVEIQTSLDSPADLIVEREDASAGDPRRWSSADLVSVTQGKDGLQAMLVDRESAGWPRTYRLILAAAYREIVLAEIRMTTPGPLAVELSALPNPFNPRVEIRFALPEPGSLNLGVFDVRGRLVRRLRAGRFPAGEGLVVWQGDDAGGRPVASGVYHVLLQTDRQAIRRSVTLVR